MGEQLAVITIRQFAGITFDLYTTVDAVLLGVAIAGDGDSATLQLPSGQLLELVGTGFTYGGSNELLTGTVTSLVLKAAGGAKIIEGSGFALDVAVARANPNTPLDDDPTYNYDASAVPPQMGWGIEFMAAARNDTIVGTEGHDDLDGLEGNDSILGLGGDDSLWGGLGSDTLRGGDGADDIFGGADNDLLLGDAGDDRIMGSSGRDTMDGGSGRDIADYRNLVGARVEVTLKGAKNAVVKVGGIAEDTITNIESVYGGTKGDKLTGDSRKNSFLGAGGKDTIDGGRGTDMALYADKTVKVEVTLNGSSQVSVKVGGKVEDKIKNIEHVLGGEAGDKLTGDSKGNILAGLDGRDKLSGGSGNDTLDGGNGRDTLEGGSGSDIFWFEDSVVPSNVDTIKDFGSTDVIGLDGFYFGALGPSVSAGELRKGTAAKDANDFLIYDRKTGKLYYDDDANGAGAQIQIAVLSNKASLSAGDFEIV